MTRQLNPYLHFDGTARAAMTFYRSVLGGDLDVMTFGDQGLEGEHADHVMHARLETADGFVLMASDTPPGMTLTRGETVTLCLSGTDEAVLRGWFESLAEGGEVHVPLAKQMWGDHFGQCADAWGVTWLVDISAT